MERLTTTKHLVWITAILLAGTIIIGCQRSAPPQPAAEEEPSSVAEQPTEPEPEPTVEPEAEPEEVAEPESEPVSETEQEPMAEPEPETQPEAEPESEPVAEPEPEAEANAEKPLDLGPPLVEGLENLKRLEPERPVWFDTKRRRVVLVGQVCQREAPLELFVCLNNSMEHEAIITVGVQALSIHAGLLAAGAEVGNPVSWDPVYTPASGSEIEITVAWKDDKGQRQTARAQDWIRDSSTGEAMTNVWVFAGSGFWVDEKTGQRHYQAEGGYLICLSNFSSAMLDLPIESSRATGELLFHAFTERIPPLGTPVTIVLKPKPREDDDPPQS